MFVVLATEPTGDYYEPEIFGYSHDKGMCERFIEKLKATQTQILENDKLKKAAYPKFKSIPPQLRGEKLKAYKERIADVDSKSISDYNNQISHEYQTLCDELDKPFRHLKDMDLFKFYTFYIKKVEEINLQ